MTKRSKPTPGPDELRALVRGKGLRCTPARLAVIEQLSAAHTPLSHADVADALAGRGFDRATVYRNLIELADSDLVSRVDLGDHVWRFEMRAADGHANDHPHFVCVDCGEISCLPTMNVSFSPTGGAKSPDIGHVTEILLKGHCGQCEAGQ